MDRRLSKFYFNFSDITEIEFVKNRPSTLIQSYNFVNISVEILKIFKICEFKIEDTCRHYSLVNSDLLQQEYSAGNFSNLLNGIAKGTLIFFFF